MRKLRGSAYKRWYETREREAVEQALAVLREPVQLWGTSRALPGIIQHLRATKAASILENFLDLAERVRGNGNGNDDQ